MDSAGHFQTQPRQLGSKLPECSNKTRPSPCQDPGIDVSQALLGLLVLSDTVIHHERGVPVAVQAPHRDGGSSDKAQQGSLELTRVEIRSPALNRSALEHIALSRALLRRSCPKGSRSLIVR